MTRGLRIIVSSLNCLFRRRQTRRKIMKEKANETKEDESEQEDDSSDDEENNGRYKEDRAPQRLAISANSQILDIDDLWE
jgi:hypothetical protein